MTEGNPHKPQLDEIKTLAMLKMEKNFIAHNEKGYPRKPYAEKTQPISFLIDRIQNEKDELVASFNALVKIHVLPDELLDTTDEKDIVHILNEMREECADISNIVDYLFEKLTTKLLFVSPKELEEQK